MSYSKQTWANGDIITASKLNHIEDGIEGIETELTNDYARTDGAYESMTVGNAEQLISSVTENDKVPYNFRTSGGSIDIGDREVDKIVGGTIAWNQQINLTGIYGAKGGNGESASTSEDHVVTITYNPVSTGVAPTNWGGAKFSKTWALNHVYLISAAVEPTFDTKVGFTSGGESQNIICEANKKTYSVGLRKPTAAPNFGVYVKAWGKTLSDGDYARISEWNVFDLTRMFGSAIADYVYGLEQATAGAGVAWFRKLFPKPYYAYDAGTLMSVKTSAHKTVGFNAWDEEWEVGIYKWETGLPYESTTRIRSKNKIPVISGKTYYIKQGGNNVDVYCYYADGSYEGGHYLAGTGNGQFTIPDGVTKINFSMYASYGTTYNHDICINLSWDGERDGEYEPYVQHTYALDSDLELRGIPKLDANNSLYYDGDTYESDGTVTRKYGIVDLGTFGWIAPVVGGTQTKAWTRTEEYFTVAKGAANNAYAKIVCSKYSVGTPNGLWTGDNKKIAVDQNHNIVVYDTDLTDMTKAQTKAAMSGVYLVYELETPTTEEADTYQNPQIVDDFGTEEYVDAAVAANTRDVAIPVGHDTNYQANLRAKLEMAPNSPDSNGDYIMRHNNGENSYVPITFPADELPAAPTEDGNYVLKCTVADGSATFTWASAT